MRTLLLMTLLTGCGYRWVSPSATSAVPALGAIDDLTDDGALGLRAAARLRRHLAGHATSGETLSGRVRLGPERAAGFDGAGLGALYRAQVRVELEVKVDGSAVWIGRAERDATWPAGATPIETTGARDLALNEALDRAIDAAWGHYLGSPG